MNSQSIRYEVLDGWRGISILLVLAAHLLPLGPGSWQLNSTAGPMGMSLFFTLSGFLITNFLLHKNSIIDFLSRRLFRILPLAWLYIVIVLVLINNKEGDVWLAHIFFYGNWPPMYLTNVTGHYWSLCVEMQFYFAIALVASLFGKRGLWLIPIFCIMVTLFRVSQDVLIAINTYYRLDEILAGGWLALFFNYNKKTDFFNKSGFSLGYYIFIFILFILSCHPDTGFMNYFRPYLAAILVGSTLYDNKSLLISILKNKYLAYLATISYALYVIHGGLRYTWLADGETFERYIKRPLFFLVLFITAHISTFYYEYKCILLGKRFSNYIHRRYYAK